MPKLTDELANMLVAHGVSAVFGLQGGAVAHIFDSLERAGLPVVYTAHESAASFAASANAKSTNGIGCCVVTTGPGTTNAITGLLGAWQDSVPCIFISGQVRSEHMSYNKPVRQIGTQEANIIDIVRPITKFAKVLENPNEIESVVTEALEIATSGRPGPVWLDVPLDFQWQMVPKCSLVIDHKLERVKLSKSATAGIAKLEELLNEAASPLLVLGYGLHLAKSIEQVRNLIKKYQFKTVCTWTASGILASNDPSNLGIIGMSGQPGANKAIFKADLIVCLGTHLSIPHTTTLTSSYAPHAKKVFINIDQDQLDYLNIKSDLNIHCGLKEFFQAFGSLGLKKTFNHSNFEDLKLLNVKLEPQKNNFVNSNNFFHCLTKKLTSEDAIVIDGGGTALYTGFQSSDFKQGQRVFCSSSMSSMGTALAEVIGVYMSKRFKNIYCIIGDGSMLMNIQDLQTIADLKIPVVICVINNNGYLAIRHTQQGFLESRFFGTHPDWKLGCVNFEMAAKAFQINYVKISDEKLIETVSNELLSSNIPTVCEVITSEDQPPLFAQQYSHNEDGTATPMSLEFMK